MSLPTTAAELRDELLGRECQCGKTKGAGKSFCYSCFMRLPRKIKHDLYKLIGDGYEEAYKQARAYFTEQDAPPRFVRRLP
ncbi:MAG: hypothetical protein WC683_04260 [bacterium]